MRCQGSWLLLGRTTVVPTQPWVELRELAGARVEAGHSLCHLYPQAQRGTPLILFSHFRLLLE